MKNPTAIAHPVGIQKETQMKAVVQDRYGSAEVLRVDEVDRPVPGVGQVLLRVKAAGLNYADWHMMTGEPTIMRLGTGFSGPKQRIRGVDVAGVVEQVGPGVTEFAVGDAVFGSASGSFAEFALSTPKRLARKPASVSFEQAAATPMAGYTALQAVRGRVSEGTRVLVLGAGGGVGSFAVQLAKHFGGHVTGVGSTGKVELIRSLGADAVIDYTSTPVTGRFDLIVDTGGNRPLPVLRALLSPRGTLVIVGGEGGGKLFGPLARILHAAALSPLVQQSLIGLFAAAQHEDLLELAALLEAGAITPAIDRVFPLEQAPDALAHFAAARHAGKVVIVP